MSHKKIKYQKFININHQLCQINKNIKKQIINKINLTFYLINCHNIINNNLIKKININKI